MTTASQRACPPQQWTPRKIVCYLLYVTLGKHLPDGYGVIGRAARRIRKILTRPLLKEGAANFGVGCGADFGNGATLILKDHANLGRGFSLSGRGLLTVGEHVAMGWECMVITQNHRYLREGYDGFEVKAVTIGNHVWIGHRVTILPGVRIGNHAIIGAGAVVVKDVPEFAIVAGNPGRVVKFRK